MAKKLLDPVLPGEILFEEFMVPLGISQNQLGRDLGVPITRINEIVNGKRAITVDTAMRLSVYFRTTPEVWLNLQQRYDIECAHRDLLPELKQTIRPVPRHAI